MEKILIINDVSGIGGTEKALASLVKLIKNNYYLKIITIFGTKDEEKNFGSHSSYLINKKFIPFFENHSSLDFLRKLFLKQYFHYLHKYDIVISFKEGECQIYAQCVKAKKHISWVQTNVIQYPWTEYLYRSKEEETNIYHKFDKIITVSKKCAEDLKTKFSISDDKVEIIPNIIDYDYIDFCCKEKLILKDDCIKFISVSRLDKIKNVFETVKIFKEISEKYDQLRFQYFIIGNGFEYDAIHEYIVNNNLQDIIQLLGEKDNPYNYMSECDILIHNSSSESFGLVFVEALYLGLNIISTNCGIISEIYDAFPDRIDVVETREQILNSITKHIENHLVKKEKIKFIDNNEIVKQICNLFRLD